MNRTAHDDWNDDDSGVLKEPVGYGLGATHKLADTDRAIRTAVSEVEEALRLLRGVLSAGNLTRQELLDTHAAVRQMQDHLAELIRETSNLFEEANGR